MISFRLVALGIALFGSSLLAKPAVADQVICVADGSGNDICVITYPNVLANSTEYPNVTFASGDTVQVMAQGCVQTGGSGNTWKRYVDPSGSNSDHLYHGLISIPGVTSGLVRISSVIGNASLPASTGGTLTLGYEDDDFSDNGYWSHDNGTDNQCSDTTGPQAGNAWVQLSIHRVAAPSLASGTRYGMCQSQDATHDTCHIDRPDVTHKTEEYLAISFRPGDTVVVNAQGCVQTGGSGNTWKRYVDPSGSDSDHLYHGLISIPGVTTGLVRLSSVVGNFSLPASTGGTLTLGYEDDDYSDNGYWSHDDGTEDQCKNAGPASLDLTITHVPMTAGPHVALNGIEVTQVIQDVNESVPLIAGKTTWARVYLDSTITPPATVTASLRVVPAGSTTPIDVIASVPTTLTPGTTLQSQRESWTNSLNFALPTAAVAAGATTFQVLTITDTTSNMAPPCDQCNIVKTVSFVATPPLLAELIGMQYTSGSPPVAQAPSAQDFALLSSWLARAYPAPSVAITTTTVAANDTFPFTCNQSNTQISAIRANDISNGTDKRTHYLGVVSNAAGFMRGCSSGVPSSPDPSTVASSPTGSPTGSNTPINVTGDTDASFGDWYGGHELAHTFGRAHPGFCNGNSQDDLSFPNPNGQISDNFGSDTGIDVGDTTVMLPLLVLAGVTHFDIMTYCNQPQWFSAYTFEGVLTRLQDENASERAKKSSSKSTSDGSSTAASSAVAAPTIVSGRFIHVVASLDLTSRSGAIRYVTPVTRASSLTLIKSPAELRSLTAQGQTIGIYPVEIRKDTDIPSNEHQTALIDAVVPYSEKLGRIQLVLDTKVKDEFRSSQQQPPSPSPARITESPKSSSSPTPAFEFLLQWKPVHLPGDKITYTVEMSGDGSIWRTIGIGVLKPELGITGQNARSRLLRVTATNGFRNSRPVILRGVRK